MAGFPIVAQEAQPVARCGRGRWVGSRSFPFSKSEMAFGFPSASGALKRGGLANRLSPQCYLVAVEPPTAQSGRWFRSQLPSYWAAGSCETAMGKAELTCSLRSRKAHLSRASPSLGPEALRLNDIQRHRRQKCLLPQKHCHRRSEGQSLRWTHGHWSKIFVRCCGQQFRRVACAVGAGLLMCTRSLARRTNVGGRL